MEIIGDRFRKELEKIFGTRYNKAVAEKYNITERAVNNFKNKNTLTPKMIEISINEDLDLNYIIKGEEQNKTNNEKIDELIELYNQLSEKEQEKIYLKLKLQILESE